MDDEFRLPRRGDNPFLVKVIEPDSPTWVSLHWLSSLRVDDSYFATAFKEAADKIVKELARGGGSQHPDIFFMPIAYLYRHALELKMKTIVGLAVKLELLAEEKNLRSALKQHNLYSLWNFVKSAVVSYWPSELQDLLSAAERIIQELHNIDKSGQALRYSKNMSGKSNLEDFPDSVQLIHLQEVFQALFNLLEGCEAGFEHAFEMRSEMLRDYRHNSY